jgi:tRNA-2-methylthio-N6-dimethylallyladenosine synthase
LCLFIVQICRLLVIADLRQYRASLSSCLPVSYDLHMTAAQGQSDLSTSADTNRSRSVYLETFGCQMNVLDSQLVHGQLQSLGYHFTEDWRQADVVLYNTCSVREQAENKAYSRVGQVGQRKKQFPEIVLGVIGCMAERDGADMFHRHPQVDFLCGPGELDKVPMLIDNVVKTRLASLASFENEASTEKTKSSVIANAMPAPSKRSDFIALQGNTHRRSSTLSAAEDQLELLDLARSFSPDEHQGSAYVRITRGCNKFCTYCVVPNTRGREIHRSPDAIIDECKRLVDSGVVEVTLLGQTVNHYQFDQSAAVEVDGVIQPQIGAVIKNDGTSFQNDVLMAESDATANTSTISLPSGADLTTFANLLARIHDQVPDLQRLRFVTSFPRDFGDDILKTIADRPRLCEYLHLPVQSGSNRILQMMNRGYTVEAYRDLLGRIRNILPDATIASDLICGFPTESEEDHQATCDLLREALFKNCFIFKYSPRPGTSAYDRLKDDVPDAIKRLRNNELLQIQTEASDAVHQSFVGKTVRVFVESVSAKETKRRNAADPTVELGWEKTKAVTQLSGRTDGDLIVMFEGDESLVGKIIDVQLTKHAPLALFGQLV